jgi:hypothetical protein
MKSSLHEIDYEKIFRPDTIASLKSKSGKSLQQMLGGQNLNQVVQRTSELVPEIIVAESDYIPQLEKLAVDMVNEIFPILKTNNINIDARILPSGQIVVNDEEEEEDDDEEETPEEVLAKRRIINGITQGASVRGAFAFLLFKEHLDDLDVTLIEKYNEILKLAFGIFDDENAIAMMLAMIAQQQKMPGGSSSIEFIEDEREGYFQIEARAICFPMLVHEIVKGLYEIVGTEGFGSDKNKNQAIIQKVDKLSNEPRDFQYGKFIYDALNDLYIDSNIDDPRVRELFFADVYKLPEGEFIEFIENAINDTLTSRQRSWALKTMEEIKEDLKSDDFDATGLDENKEFDFKKYLSEGKLLKEIEIGIKSSYNEFYKVFLNDQIRVHKDVPQDSTDITIEELEDKRNNPPPLPDLESLAQAILDIDDMMTEDAGEYLGSYNAELLNWLQELGDSTDFSEIDELISLVKLPDEDE